MVVAGGEGVQVVEAVYGDGVFGCVVADGGCVAGDVALCDVVRGLCADEETVTAEDGIGCERGSLWNSHNLFDRKQTGKKNDVGADLEQVECGTCVESGLLVNGTEDSRFLALLGEEGGVQVELEALGDLVLELDLVAEDVGGGPGLGDGEAVFRVSVLGLDVAVDDVLGVAVAADFESDVGGCFGLDFESGAVVVVVFGEKVV